MGQGPWERESAGVVYGEERLSHGGRIRKGRMCSRPICVVEIKFLLNVPGNGLEPS